MVEGARILLLDLEAPPGLVAGLRELLAASSKRTLQLLVSRIEHDAGGPPSLRPEAEFRPDLICFLFGSHCLRNISQLFRAVTNAYAPRPVVAVVEAAGPDEILEILRGGARDFIVSPLRANDALPRIWRLLRPVPKEDGLVQRLKRQLGLLRIVGESPNFLNEVKKIPLVANCDVAILIRGETGTGKELFCRAIHYLSPRAEHPFVPVNCGAIPTELAETELFGHERGAFTGATQPRVGLIEEARGGTVFLDEVDCLTPAVQVKLLRFLQEKEYRPVGSNRFRKADVRIIAASNSDLLKAVKSGKLRQDLFYRLDVISLTLPPLRERLEDIPLLAHHFLAKYRTEFDKRVDDFSAAALKKLLLYDWPGNVRELENVIERAVLFSDRFILDGSDLELPPGRGGEDQESFQQAKARVVDQFERGYIKRLLVAYSGNISRAARAAQKNRRAFWELIRKHGIDADRFRSKSVS